MFEEIKKLIEERRAESQKSDFLTPARASEISVELSALLGIISEEYLKREMAYNQMFEVCYRNEGKSNRAEILAKCTPEYQAMRECENLEKSVAKLISSLNKFVELKEHEWRHSGNL